MARTVVSMSELMTLTRASAKVCWNAAGGLTSFAADTIGQAFNPVSGAGIGFLLEPAATQLMSTPSEPHNVLTTISGGTVSANQSDAPDGTATMAEFTMDSAASQHYISRGNLGITTAGTLATYSFFLKNNGANKIRLRVYDHSDVGSGVYGDFDLSAGTVLGAGIVGAGAVIGAKIETYGPGKHRIFLTGTPNVGSVGNIQIRLVCLNAAGTTENFAGDGASGFYFWGGNAVAGALAGSFISTAGTRAVDIVRWADLSPWFNSAKGTFRFRARMFNAAPAGVKLQLFRADDGTDDNVIEAFVPAGTANVEARIRAAGSTVFNQVAGSFTAGSDIKLALTYGANAFGASLNGATAVTGSSGAVPSGINVSWIGCSDNAGSNSLANTMLFHGYTPDTMSAGDLATWSIAAT